MSENTALPQSDAEWRERLDPMQYRVLREGDTEHPFAGAYWNSKEPGIYRCAGCGMELFDSETKYDSGTGWPSFWEAMDPDRIETRVDNSYGMVRHRSAVQGMRRPPRPPVPGRPGTRRDALLHQLLFTGVGILRLTPNAPCTKGRFDNKPLWKYDSPVVRLY